ncbi:hypothetical protein G8759_14335 [Spirosoma aureum]|uniref:Beta-galactosidase jelly roll domain-containing protein n=1 Tax=Spirosoma aureum TaxID=2692134 RepID=A0A6G9ANC8_9BACT|nr:hypothetical protein G8759_14335 [Spirosoma aureum]
MIRYASLFLVFVSLVSTGLSQPVFQIHSLPSDGILLNNGWHFHTGDNPAWANPTFNDSQWMVMNPTQDIKADSILWKAGQGWFRLRFSIDDSLAKQSLSLLIQQTGASQIFLNGQLIGKFGDLGTTNEQVQAVTPVNSAFIGMPVWHSGQQVLAIRFAIQKGIPYIVFADRPNTALSLRLIQTNHLGLQLEGNVSVYFDFLRAGLYFIFFIIHFALFWFNSWQKSNRYFFLYALLNSISCVLIGLAYEQVHLAATRMVFLISLNLVFLVGQLFLLTAIYTTFNQRRGIVYWGMVLYAVVRTCWGIKFCERVKFVVHDLNVH